MAPSVETNPLLSDWTVSEPFGLPPWSKIKPEHFQPAFEVAMAKHIEELTAIASNSEKPSFQNTCAAFDRAGTALGQVDYVFSHLCGSLNPEPLQKVQTAMAPISAAHETAVFTGVPGLFDRIDAVLQGAAAAGLVGEQLRLVQRQHLDFTRKGAKFDEKKKRDYAVITAKLAELTTQFDQNVTADEGAFTITMTRAELAGCPESLVAAAKEAAKEAGKTGDDEFVITLSRSLVEPFLTFADNRALREKAWRAWTKRGELSPERDNKKIATEILTLRQQKAQMHGCKTFAEYQMQDMMAKTPNAVMELLENVWGKAKVSADKERAALVECMSSQNGTAAAGGIEPWDWRYYAEKVRLSRYDFDEDLLKPYLSLEAVTAAAFDVSGRLYGLEYMLRPDIQSYHPDVNTYEVRQKADGKLVAIFIHDNFARKDKRSGAWMNELRQQHRNPNPGDPEISMVPIIGNNNNFAKGSPTLLSFDDATTLFHEFGHGHHGMLSNVEFKRLASTNVLTDFVELPSQLFEHWLKQRAVQQHFKHHETQELVPEALLEKLKAAMSFNQGFATIEYTACALLDQLMHTVEDMSSFDLSRFEEEQLARLGMPQGIVMRHRPTHFGHLFACEGYAAAYYVYLWAEVLDADAFDAFIETGDCFNAEVAARCKQFIYSAGNSRDPAELFRLFRGRDPIVEPMLRKKGLV